MTDQFGAKTTLRMSYCKTLIPWFLIYLQNTDVFGVRYFLVRKSEEEPCDQTSEIEHLYLE